MNESLENSFDTEAYSTYVNVIKASDVIWLYVSPLIIILGTFGNGMSLVILSKMNTQGQSTVTTFLLALAGSDLLLLYFGLLRLWLYYLLDFDFMSVNRLACKVCKWIVYVSGATSAWLLVAVTLQRTVSVVWPHRMNAVCTPTTSRVMVAGIAAFLMVVHLHVLYGMEVVADENGNVTYYQCYISDNSYLNFFTKIWSWVDLLIFSLTPFAILIVSNTVLVKTVLASARFSRRPLTVSDSKQVADREKRASSMTLTLITISCAFLLLTCPFCIYLLIKPYILKNYFRNIRERAILEILIASINMLWYSNSAGNFYLYCLTGSRFRMEFKKIFLRNKYK